MASGSCWRCTMWRPVEMTIGHLYGLGVGPGDPELLTLKALRLLRAAPVVAYPAPDSGASFARGIVAEWLDRNQREIAIRFPMRPERPPDAVYDDAAARLAVVLDAGDDIAFLCQGDPLFYGSFAGILGRLVPRYRVTVVPGVSSLTACAAAAGLPLAQRDDSLTVIPATLAEDELARRLAESEAAAVIKIGRHFAKLRRVLAGLGLLDRAVYIERASLPNQRIEPLAQVDPASVPYFATALILREGSRR
jgi:precorrin-2/cobalt-factor-2 C20-methyltransferase